MTFYMGVKKMAAPFILPHCLCVLKMTVPILIPINKQIEITEYIKNTFFSSMVQQLLVGLGILIIEASRSLFQTHHTRQDSSGRVISPSQRPLPDNTQHSQETRHPCTRRDSNPQSQQANGRRPKPQTARPLGSAKHNYTKKLYVENQIIIMFHPLSYATYDKLFSG